VYFLDTRYGTVRYVLYELLYELLIVMHGM